jgi:sterol desaturase/sphingolipid hydroxylase (fatty acid hydroxylase superfamily)
LIIGLVLDIHTGRVAAELTAKGGGSAGLRYDPRMDLVALAAPLFLLGVVVELLVNRVRKTNLYRSSDAINSISAGILSKSFEYFTRFIALVAWGFILENFSLIDMPLSWFDASPRGVSLWILAALGWDFCYYWSHRLSHEISILWAAHGVHHQSEDYNLSTALRQTSTGFLFVWIFYLPLFLIGFPLEVLLVVSAGNLIYQFWVHTQLIKRLGVLDYILVTPSNHRVHHAQNERYIDKNYGGVLILWDRMFGTFEDESSSEPVVFGVRKPLANWNPFWANLQIYDYLLFDAMHTKKWRDKIGIWFRRTGWRPADVAERYPKKRADLATFQKFDPAIEPWMRRYVLAQFIVALALALATAELFANRGAHAVIIPCLVLWTQLYTLGVLNEGRAYAIRVEVFRLLVVLPLAAWEMSLMADFWPWSMAVGYAGLSLVGLLIVTSRRLDKFRNINV